MKILKIVAIFLCTVVTACSNPTKTSSAINTFNFNKANVSLEIEIFLPASYNQADNINYPVLYLLDGFWNKDSIRSIYHDLRFDNMVPEIIIVSIGYPETIKDVEEQRMWDLTPNYDSGFKAGGKAAVMLEVISEKIIPFMGKNYRVDNTRTILTGHSLAGLFTLYAMYQNPKTFTHYAAISPSALWANEALSNMDNEYAEMTKSLPTNLYITYGTDEYAPYVHALKNYIHQLVKRDYLGLHLSLANVESLRHVGMKSEGFLRSILWSLTDRKPIGPSEFEKKNIAALKQPI